MHLIRFTLLAGAVTISTAAFAQSPKKTAPSSSASSNSPKKTNPPPNKKTGDTSDGSKKDTSK